MLYQDLYQSHGDPSRMNISSVVYGVADHDNPSLSSSDGKSELLPTFPSHCHSFYEIVFIIEEQTLDSQSSNASDTSEKCLFFYPSLMIHAMTHDKIKQRLVLQFAPRMIQFAFRNIFENACLFPGKELKENGFLRCDPDSALYQAVLHLCEVSPKSLGANEEFHLSVTKYSPLQEAEITAAFYQVLTELIRMEAITVEDSSVLLENEVQIQALINRLVLHPELHISMEEAAAFANLSYSNFCRTFKESVGVTYTEFCNTLRIKEAQDYLLNSKTPIAEISSRLNFGSVSYFNRIFKKYTGFTPSEFRSQR